MSKQICLRSVGLSVCLPAARCERARRTAIPETRMQRGLGEVTDRDSTCQAPLLCCKHSIRPYPLKGTHGSAGNLRLHQPTS